MSTNTLDNIKLVKGNIFNSEMQVIVNPVNAIGVMGKGLALEFKNRYALMYKEYSEHCINKKYLGGTIKLYRSDGQRIMCFATKHHWKDNSRMEYITEGLNTFINKYTEWRVKSIAFPMLVAGLGGLPYDVVLRTLKTKLLNVTIPVEIYVR